MQPNGGSSWSSTAARTIGVFAVLGAGLGSATLIFMKAIGAFDPAAGVLGGAILGGLAVVSVLLFSLLAGMIVAIVGAVHAARRLPTRGQASLAAGVAGAIGHVIMIFVLSTVLIIGIAILAPHPSGGQGASNASPVDSTSWATLGKLMLGFVTSGLVGAASAALLFEPETDEVEPNMPDVAFAPVIEGA